MEISRQKIEIKNFDEYVHYYLDDKYIGMFFFKKGELSDHRAIVRRNRIKVDKNNLHQELRFSLFALLNHVLSEKFFLEGDELQKSKTKIVVNSEDCLKAVSEQLGAKFND